MTAGSRNLGIGSYSGRWHLVGSYGAHRAPTLLFPGIGQQPDITHGAPDDGDFTDHRQAAEADARAERDTEPAAQQKKVGMALGPHGAATEPGIKPGT